MENCKELIKIGLGNNYEYNIEMLDNVVKYEVFIEIKKNIEVYFVMRI